MSESASARGRKVNVTAVDIVTFFKNLQIQEMDELVIKMDVEGAEYALCRRMIDYCLFPLIDRIGIGKFLLLLSLSPAYYPVVYHCYHMLTIPTLSTKPDR